MTLDGINGFKSRESVMITFKDGYHVVEPALVRNFSKPAVTDNFMLNRSKTVDSELFDAFQLSDPFDVTYEIFWANRLKN